MPNPVYTLLPEIARRYGDVANVPVPLPGMTMTLVSHPDHIEHILTRNHTRYPKHKSTRELFFDQPPALPILEGEEWKRTRRWLNPHFGQKALDAVGDQTLQGLSERVAAWATHVGSAKVIDLQHELGVVVADGLVRSILSRPLSTEQLDKFVASTQDYGRYVMVRMATYFLPQALPKPFRARGEAAKHFMLTQFDEFITRRKAEGPRESQDVLDVLLAMPFTGSAQAHEARVRSELLDLVLAGVETTAAAIAWSVALLYADPLALARARAEVDALDGEPLEYRHLQDLTYLRCCFDEAQRIQSVTPVNLRTAREDDEIGGYFIPAGSQVLFSPYGLHHDPRYWVEPEKFRPSRFLDDSIRRNAFLPFSIGPRKCMGYRLANIEGVLTLAAILQRYEINFRPGWLPRHVLRGATGLSGGLPVTLDWRSSPSRAQVIKS
ncbi:cytochrome P450 [Mycobacterium sp. 852002-40037_SCH5390672]|nr:cytochrome P450 [Mycobacterium sp. 852002-40037_SCH5390672]